MQDIFLFSKTSRMSLHLFIRYRGWGERLTTPLILVWRLRMMELYLHSSCKSSWCACVYVHACVYACVCVGVCVRWCAKTLLSPIIRNKTVLIVPFLRLYCYCITDLLHWYSNICIWCYTGTFVYHCCSTSHLACSSMGLCSLGHSELKCVFPY